MFTAIITAIIFGIIVGALGRLVLPGKQNISIAATLVIGIVAALLGTFVAYLLGVSSTNGINWIQHILQIAFAAIGIVIYERRQTVTR